MFIIQHRANDWQIIEQSRKTGVGIEVDVRSAGGKLYLSHDLIIDETNCVPLSDLIKYSEENSLITILDMKETGLIKEVAHLISIPELFYITDVIFPDQLVCKELELLSLSRKSFFEDIHETDGYWIDYVFNEEDLNSHSRESYYRAIVVSPELHKHNLKHSFIDALYNKNAMGVCTDAPIEYILAYSLKGTR